MAFFCWPHLSQYCFRYSAVITWHGCAFIFKNERHLLAKNGVDKYIFLCVGDSFYVDPNARNKIQGSHVCCLYFKLEWQSSKCKAEKKIEFFRTVAPLPVSMWEYMQERSFVMHLITIILFYSRAGKRMHIHMSNIWYQFHLCFNNYNLCSI